ncbi:GTPase [Scytonema hofmannii PCC 7110]|uniref:GTPase n=2 Tax=Scytonema hofmannii TaxID=34078 RepID=A0A139WYQ3_9CYAN|nr:GTPase [Scytonema hofmannii PCC 7110]
MLVVNKMSDGAGEEEELITNYRHSIASALEPYSLDEFSLCFIDAKDYCEGVDEKDEFLTEISRFQTLIDSLNSFVQRRDFFARFDTLVRIAVSYVDEAQLSLTRDSNKDSAFFELLNRLSRTVRQERDRLRTKVRGIALRLSAAIANEGIVLARAVGSNVDIEALAKQAESNVQNFCEKVKVEMEEAVKEAVELLQEEVKKVLNSDLAQAFVARLELNQTVSAQNVDSSVEVNQTVSARNVESDVDVERLREQVKMLQDIGEQVGVGITKLATKTGAKSTEQVFLRATNAAGSVMHKGVYTVGKFLGFNFKPWQAVNIAKGIGNVAKFLGPILSVGMLAMDVYAKEQEEEQDKKLADARREITSQFIAVAKDIESQIEVQLREVEAQIYREIEKRITSARQNEEEAIASSNQWVGEIAALRKEFSQMLCEINNSSDVSKLLD